MPTPSSSEPSIFLVGATGLVGHATTSTILSSPSRFSSLTTITRRPLPDPSGAPSSLKHTNLVFDFQNPKTWSLAREPAAGTTPNMVFVSCLGTTKAQAGSIEAQRKIDLDLNLQLATAAREEGMETIILVSSTGAKADSYSPYGAMKGELEEEVKKLGFKRTLILQPGLLVGDRGQAPARMLEGFAQGLFKGLRRAGVPMMDRAGIDAEVLAKAIANLAHSKEEGVHYYSNKQLIDAANA